MRIAFLDWSTNGIARAGDLETRPLGGRVTCLRAVSRRLAQGYGHDVVVVTPGIPEPFRDEGSVLWTSRLENKGLDWLVFLRGIGDGAPGIRAEHRALWVRDLPHSGFAPDPRLLACLDVTVFLSDYAERVWRKFYGRHLGASQQIPNGVDPAVFYPPDAGERARDLILYASAPNRGLAKLPLLCESLRELGLSHRMVALSNLETLHPGEVSTSEDFVPVYAQCREAGVELRDPVPQPELAQWLRCAAFLVKPNGYPEICSNLELQALACGCPIVTTGGLGSTPEWVEGYEPEMICSAGHPPNGLLTEFQPHDYVVYDVEILRHCRDLLQDDRLWQRLCQGAEKTVVPSWDMVARRWEGVLGTDWAETEPEESVS